MAESVAGFPAGLTKEGEDSAVMSAAVLFFDISGFTPLAERLSSTGHEGAETLSGILQGLYTSGLHGAILEAGGFVSCFSGDSFTVIIPDSSPESATELASIVMAGLEANAASDSIRRHALLSFRVGLAVGQLQWRRVGDVLFLYGEPLREACSTQVKGLQCMSPPDVRQSGPFDASGEFRRIFIVFVSAPDESADSLTGFVSDVVDATGKTGGYFGGVHYDGTGPYVMTLFGAPWSHGDNGARALRFVDELEASSGFRFTAGITCGTVYAGHTGFPERFEYTVLGTQVNTAARLMRHASGTGAFIEEDSLSGIPGCEPCGEPFPLELKGLSGAIRVFRRGDVTLRKPGAFRGRLLGRSREMMHFLEAAGETPACVLIHGRAGIGKSHFAWEATAALESRGYRRMVLGCSDMSDQLFEPFRSMLRKVFKAEDGSEVFSAALTRLAHGLPPESVERVDLVSGAGCLAVLLGLSGQVPTDPKTRYERTLLALRATLLALAAETPLVLLLEDIQWADSGTSELLELILRAGVSDLLPVLTARTGDTGLPQLAGIRRSMVFEMPMGALEPQAVSGIFMEISGKPPDKGLMDFLESRTAGNPLFADQFARYLLESGGLVERDGSFSLVGATSDIPYGIADVLQARLDTLPGRVRSGVLTASVLGLEFPDDVFGEMQGADFPEVLETGRELNIWRESEPGFHAFTHGLLRDAACSFLLHRRKRELHGAAAVAMEIHQPGNHPELARHWELSDEPVKALKHLDLSALEASSAYSLRESLDYRRRLISILRTTGFSDSGLELRSRKDETHLLGKLNMWDEALEAAEKASDLARETGDRVSLSEMLSFTGWLLLRKGRHDQAEKFVLEGLSIVRECEAPVCLARALGHLGAIKFYAGDFVEAERLFLEEMDVLDSVDSQRDRFMCMVNLGCVYKDTGRNARAERLFSDGLALAVEFGDPDFVAIALGNRAALYRNLGRFDEALHDHDRALEICSRTGDDRSLSVHLGGTALINYDLGRLDRALELYSRQLRLVEDLDWKFGVAEANGYMATCLEAMGRTEEAMDKYDLCLQTAGEIGVIYYKGIFSVLKAGLLFKVGRFQEANILNETGLEICLSTGVAETALMAKLLRCRLKLREGAPGNWMDEMSGLVEEETRLDLKAYAAHSLWKALQDLPGGNPEETREARLCALELARQACAERPGYENRKLLAELEDGD